MKKNIIRITVIVLSISASFIVLTRLSTAQQSRSQDSSTTNNATEKTVDQVFKNIRVFNGMPQSKLYPTMRFMAASLGFQCGSCHVIKGFIDAAADDKPEKQTARQMIKMVMDINKTMFQGNATVTCYTCHRGHRIPQGAPVLPLPMPSPNGSANPSASVRGVVSADEVLNKFFVSIGGKAAIDRITNCIVNGTTTTAVGQVVTYEAEQVAPDKGREVFGSTGNTGRPCAGDSRCEYERILNGHRGWLKSGAGVQELVGEQLGDQRLTFPLFEILKLKDQYTMLQTSGRDRIDERDVYVLSAARFDGKAERLYFDIENGLLRRRISYLRSPIGTIPQQTDFEDYREVDGLKLPFKIRIAFADPGSVPITRNFAEIRFNVSLDPSKFEKPQ